MTAHAPELMPTPPFDNCRYQMCDLPGQCRSEGKCHHPRMAEATRPAPAPSGDEVENMAIVLHNVDWRQQVGLNPDGSPRSWETNPEKDWWRKLAKAALSSMQSRSAVDTPKVLPWRCCPECWFEEYVLMPHLGQNCRGCKRCGQEWWTDIDYTDVVLTKLRRLQQDSGK